MMSSESNKADLVDLTKKYSDDKWVIDIYSELEKISAIEDLQNAQHSVCICQVPESLSSGKPEAFLPMFVGLGPYHHYRAELTLTKDLKLAAAKRVLKHLISNNNSNEFHQLIVTNYSSKESEIKALYHPDVNSAYNDQTLFYVLTVDGFFLLAFIKLLTGTNRDRFPHFLSGNLGMPLFNRAGVELTKNALIREVFMLENQIPFHVLNNLNRINCNTIQSADDLDLGSMLKNFCGEHCPLVNLLDLPKTKKPEECDHLLDLMYHLVLVPPQKPPQKQPRTGTQPQSQPEVQNNNRKTIDLGKCFQGIKEAFKKENPCCYRCCSICCHILVFMFVMYILVASLVVLIWKLISGVSRFLFGVGRKILSVLLIVLKFMASLLNPVFRVIHDNLSALEADYKTLEPYVKLFGALERATSTQNSTDSNEDVDVRPVVMIPSVKELREAGITFQAAEKGGISSSTVDFDEEKCVFYLPCLKLDVNSEVIIRNLVAYESLTKPNGLIFTRYIGMMRAIIDTAEDEKLLVDVEIIRSELRNEVIAEVFNGMSKSIRKNTMTAELDKVINKVNAKFDILWKRKKKVTKYTSAKFIGAVGGLVFLALTAMQTYCTVRDCSRD